MFIFLLQRYRQDHLYKSENHKYPQLDIVGGERDGGGLRGWQMELGIFWDAQFILEKKIIIVFSIRVWFLAYPP